MRLTTYFTPNDVVSTNGNADDIYIVIDVIRATTSMTVILERGVTRIFAAQTLEQAQQARQEHPDRLLAGERRARQLEGFDYGNSPVQFSQADLAGRELVLTTTNGTRAFFACPSTSTRLAGCFYNAQAVAAHALELAREQERNIALVCAGESHYFALDDAVCAGYIALELQKQYPKIQIHESVYAATALYNTYAPPRLLDYCRSAQAVREAGLGDDVTFCIEMNRSAFVPIVTGQEPVSNLLILERASHHYM